MSYTNGENPGAPYGARWDDDYPSGPAPRSERYDVTHPWVGRGCEPCDLARKRDSPRGGCPEHFPLKMQIKIDDGPGPDDRLPCAGRHLEFWVDEVTDDHREMCRSCPFLDWCLSTAIANDEHFVWGMTTREERMAMKEAKLVA